LRISSGLWLKTQLILQLRVHGQPIETNLE
jgi:hypothetical protein